MFRKPSNLSSAYSRFFSNNAFRVYKSCNRSELFASCYTPNRISKRTISKCIREYKGVYNVLKRSGVKDINQFKKYVINSTRTYCRDQGSNGPKPDKNPKKIEDSKSEPTKDNKGKKAEKKKENGKDEKEKKDEKIKEQQEKLFTHFAFRIGLSLITALVIMQLFPRNTSSQVLFEDSIYISFNEFIYQMLAKGEVEKIIVRPDISMIAVVLHDGAVIKNRKADHKVYFIKVADPLKFEEKVREAEKRLGIKPGQGVNIVYERSASQLESLISDLLILGLFLLLLLPQPKNMKGTMNFLDPRRAKFTLIDPLAGQGKGVKFADIAGLKEAKQEVLEFVDYLKRPEFYTSIGAKVPKGALLLGPPGCGKTMLAKAVATESNVPFLSMNGSEFIEVIGGIGAARVRDLFKEARKRRPCIVYIDEIDAIGKKRSSGDSGSFDGGSREGEQTLNQLLTEMDGMASKSGVLMLASTNRAEVLDKALLRPGRFDRHILIDLPTLEERKEIFEQHLKTVKLEEGTDVYSKRLALLTPGFSGADIANVVNEAALHAARDKKKSVQRSDLEYAVERVVGGTEKRFSAIAPEERKIYAYHEAGHAIMGWMLEHTEALLKVSIVPRTSLKFGFTQTASAEHFLYTKEELFDKMCMALGGRVAETLTFNKVTTTGEDDLKKVTRMAYLQIRQFGMSPNVGLVSFDEELLKGPGKRPYSNSLANLMDHEARRLTAEAYMKTEEILKKNKDKLQLLAETLLKKETLNYDEIEKLIGPSPFPNKNKIDPIAFELSVRQVAGPEPEPKVLPKKEREPTQEEFSEVSFRQ